MQDFLNSKTLPCNLAERNKRMYNNSLMSDVSFIVKDNATGNKASIPAHKYVLSIGSPVFFRMFYGELAEKSGLVELVDADSESLLEILRFLYSDECKLTARCVLRVMYLAEKYMVNGLLEICADFLMNEIDADNVFEVLTQCENFRDTEKLQQRCWNIVDLQTRQCLQAKNFMEISQGMLNDLVRRDTLNIDEQELFEAILTWAEVKCRMSCLESKPQNIKELIGDALSQIRVPLTEGPGFFNFALELEFLTPESLTKPRFFQPNCSDQGSSTLTEMKRDRCSQFPWQRRALKPFRCCRLSVNEPPPLFAPYERTDSFSFITDQAICISGVRIISSERKVNDIYTVTTKLFEGNRTCLSCVQATYSVKYDGTEGLPGFDVYFNEPILVKPGPKYSITIFCPVKLDLLQRIGKKVEVNCQGVNFYFPDSTHRQFSELIFHPLVHLW